MLIVVESSSCLNERGAHDITDMKERVAKFFHSATMATWFTVEGAM